MKGESNTYTLLVEMKIRLTTMEISMVVPQKKPTKIDLGMVVHACNSNSSGGEGRKIMVLRPA
jgi:hypothetical protein